MIHKKALRLWAYFSIWFRESSLKTTIFSNYYFFKLLFFQTFYIQIDAYKA